MQASIERKKHYFRDGALVPPLAFIEVSIGELFCELIHIKNNDDPNINRLLAHHNVLYPHIVVPFIEEEPHQEPTKIEMSHQRSSPLHGIIRFIEKYWNNAEQNDNYVEYQHKIEQELERHNQQIPQTGTDNNPTNLDEYQGTQSIPRWKSILNVIYDFAFQGLIRPTHLFKGLEDTFLPNESIRAFSWHRYQSKFAVALRDNSIRLFNLSTGQWSSLILKHEFQTDVFSIAWKPLSGSQLAVGTRYGVLLWTIISKETTDNDPIATKTGTTPVKQSPYYTKKVSYISTTSSQDHTSPIYTEVSAWCNYLHYPGYAPINSIDWSPSGRFLAVGSIQNSRLLIWDTFTETPTQLFQFCLGNIERVFWSPFDDYIAVSTSGNQMRVWETRNWTSQRIELAGPVRHACWAGTKDHLAVTVKGDELLYIFRLSTKSSHGVDATVIEIVDMSAYSVPRVKYHPPKHQQSVGSGIFSSQITSPTKGSTPKLGSPKNNIRLNHNDDTEQDEPFDENETFGGPLSFVAWDRSSTRLVIALEGTELLAVFQTRVSTFGVELQPLGYMRGPPETFVTGMYFKPSPSASDAAILAVTYHTGKISFYPMIYKPHL